MKKTFKSCALFCILLNSALAETNYKLELSTRTKPKGTNFVAEAAYDHLLWGEQNKTKPLYGYARVGAKIGGSPTLAAFVQVAPIAPLIFEVSKSTTKRFLKSSEFNCDQYECIKTVDRIDLSARAVFGYKDFFGSTSFVYREIKTKSNIRSTALELEYFIIPSGTTESYRSHNILLGQKFGEDLAFGLAYEKGQIKNLNKRYENSVGFCKFLWKDVNWVAGAGHFGSTESGITGNGAFLSISKKFGETLSL